MELPFTAKEALEWEPSVFLWSHPYKEQGQGFGKAANTEKLGQQQEALHLRVVRTGCIAKSNLKNYHRVIIK